MKDFRIPLFFLALLISGCSQTAPSAPMAAQLQQAPAANQQVHDLCFKEFAVSCDKLPHLLGPENAESRGESEACFNNHIHDHVNGKWVIRLGNIYCLAVTA